VAGARPGAPPPDPDKEYEPPRLVWAKFGLDPFHFERMMKAFASVRHSLGSADLSASQMLLHIVEHWLDSEHGAGEAETEVSAVAPAGEAGSSAHLCAPEAGDNSAHVCCADEAPDSAQVCCADEPPNSAHMCCEPAPQPARPRRGEHAHPVNYRIVEHRCPSCQAAWTEGRAGRIELDTPVRAMIECDAEVVAGDTSAGTPGHITRIIPPATRRAVLVRDQGRCQVPGCAHRRHLELHHILPRAERGGHQAENLVVMCWTHHEMLHRGIIGVQRGPDGLLTWTRSGGDPLGILVSIHREHAELEHNHLEDFEGPMGSWPCIQGYWGALDPPVDLLPPWSEASDDDRPRPPRGRASFVLGDEERPAPDWMMMGVRV
jgi:5-methylcytosine-specific restriction endonuclease McrA